MHELRYGIIGCGVIGPLHAHAVTELPNARLMAACDVERHRAEAMAAKYAVPVVLTDYHELLARSDVDAVCICTPHYLHAEMAISAARAGKHVLCEKPMAIKKDDMDAMIAEADRAGTQLGVCFQHRFAPVSVKLKTLIDQGKFGTMLLGSSQLRCLRDKTYYDSAPWRGTWAQEGGGVLINQAIHTIDLMLWMLGEVSSVTGTCATLRGRNLLEVEDTASAIVTFASGAQGTIAATSASQLEWQSRLQLYGKDGAAEVNHGLPHDYASLVIDGQSHALSFDEPIAQTLGKKCYGNSHTRALASFTDCVLQDRPFPISGREGRRAVDLILDLYRSSPLYPGAKV
jgi:UDP-N-acetyl-2-amino-2-deoxyglucuronate dehydrogenase